MKVVKRKRNDRVSCKSNLGTPFIQLMKNTALFLLLLLCSFTVSAQTGYDALITRCIEKLPPGLVYKRSYAMKWGMGYRIYEFSAILLKDTEYVLRVTDAINSPCPFAIGVELLDGSYQSVSADLMIIPHQGFRFVCRQTDKYVFRFYYKNHEHHPDGAAVLAFRPIPSQ